MMGGDPPGGVLAMQTRMTDSAADLTVETGPQPSDSRLVEQTRQGDHAAFGQLVQRYERRLQRVIQRFVADPDTVSDLAQESFLRVYQRLDQFDPARRFGPWLFRIAVNLALDHHRRRKRRRWSLFFFSRDDSASYDPPAADPRQEQDLQQEVRQVIDQLPEIYRTVLVLRELENFSSSEIAAILDRQETTIRWRLAEARTRFQELWLKRLNR
jgi:RNA polymerase sigma-70 factor (ECF subfamily)